MSASQDVDAVLELEREPQTTSCRRDGERVRAQLADRGGRRARRTSLWRSDPEGWRLVHHQGTLLQAP